METEDKSSNIFKSPIIRSFYDHDDFLGDARKLASFIHQYAEKYLEKISQKDRKERYSVQVEWKGETYEMIIPWEQQQIRLRFNSSMSREIKKDIPRKDYIKSIKNEENPCLIFEFDEKASQTMGKPIFQITLGDMMKKSKESSSQISDDNEELDDKILGQNSYFNKDDLKLDSLTISNKSEIKRQIITNLNIGKHIILIGPPGTGKTEIAELICKMASNKGVCLSYKLSTATSDWSAFETIGGYFPSQNTSTLEFLGGIFLSAIENDNWLIIDEINRADIDKSFGPFFTVLSGKNVELPYREITKGNISKKNIGIEFDNNSASSGYDDTKNAYVVGKNWRIIATMNSFDKFSLFTLSYAFMRRFAFVSVKIPNEQDLLELIKEWDKDKKLELHHEKIEKLSLRDIRPIGPSIIKSIIEYLLANKNGLNFNFYENLTDCIENYIFPLLEGLNVLEMQKAIELIQNLYLSEIKNYSSRIKNSIKQLLGSDYFEQLEFN